MKASHKMLGPQRASSPFLDLLESGGLRDKPAQLQLHLARIPEWGQDLQLLLRIRRVPDSTHPQGPIGLVVRFCAQALLHGGGTRKPLWRHTVRLNLDFGKGECEAGVRRHLRGGELWGHEHSGAGPARSHRDPSLRHTHLPGSEAASCCTSDAIPPGKTQQ